MSRVCCVGFLICCLGWSISSADALGCYACTNVTATSNCGKTVTCASADSRCRLQYTTTATGKVYTLGCAPEKDCPSTSPGIVGRSVTSANCDACCATDNCNRQLCQQHDPSCRDNADFDCPTIGATINYCDEPHRARTYCKNFCGLCSLRDGAWSSWSAWSDCSVTCGNGTQNRSRTCSNPAPWNGGDDCVGTAHAVQTCSMKKCPVHGGWTSWSSWGSCSVTCDVGLVRRDRYCGNPYPSADGSFCNGNGQDEKICIMPGCTNGGWSAWASWSACSHTCGDGVHSRSRTCDNPTPSITGRSCAGESGQTQLCKVRNCHDGGWATWASWSTCSHTCGDGIRSRSRTCDNPVPSTSGRFCRGDPVQMQPCRVRNCHDGGWATWASWSTCSHTCGDGIRSRSRTCDNPVPSTSGRYCAGDSGQTQSCRVGNCHDGGWSTWGSWGACSRTCGDGIQSRSRTCDNPVPSISGRYCVGDSGQTQSCRVRHCHAKVSAFTVTNPTGDGGPLHFSTTVFNEGSNFNAGTGKFTCSVPGVYFFALSLIKRRSSDDSVNDFVGAYIRLNGNNKVFTAIDPDDNSDNGSYGTSATVTLRLQTGDVVDVWSDNSNRMSPYTMFSGFLIQPDEP